MGNGQQCTKGEAMAESTLKIGPEPPKENRLGLKALDYGGGKTTLCAGCGHDAVSNQIIRAFYEMNVKPEKVAKFSGIGCSSKTRRTSSAARTASTPSTAACPP